MISFEEKVDIVNNPDKYTVRDVDRVLGDDNLDFLSFLTVMAEVSKLEK